MFTILPNGNTSWLQSRKGYVKIRQKTGCRKNLRDSSAVFLERISMNERESKAEDFLRVNSCIQCVTLKVRADFLHI